jgi:hypothetical protein
VDPINQVLGLTSGTNPSKRPGKVVARALKTVVFDLPVTWYFVSWNHEYGHITRSNEAGIDVALRRVGTPWSYPRFDLVAINYPRPAGPLFDLGAESGGLEASFVLKDRIEQEAAGRGLSAGEAMTAIWASLNTPLYAQINTPDDLGQTLPTGDVARYAHQWVRDSRRHRGVDFGSTQAAVARLRRRTLLNVVDAALIANVFGVLHDYVWHGRENVPTRTLSVRGVAFVPALRYALTPLGPEFSVRATVRTPGSEWRAYHRSAETTTNEPATGFGIQYSRSLTRRWASRLDADFWSQPAYGRGSRQQVYLRFRPWSMRTDRYVEIGLGRKSAGYLQGQPERAGWQVGSTLGYGW